MCDIWKQTDRNEYSIPQVRSLLADFEQLQVRWVVLSGGEPLMYSNWLTLCKVLRERGVRVTILSTGLLFERNAGTIVENADDAIVSLDGPPAVHDRIRRVPGGFGLLARGVDAIHRRRADFPVSARSTVQRENFRHLRETADTAERLGLASISYLAADMTSEAFNRPNGWSAAKQSEIALAEADLPVLESEIEALIAQRGNSPFLAESPQKLRRIALHFRAHLGLAEPVAPVCNAPWVSAVIETDGSVRPCFFHPPMGNAFSDGLYQVVTGEAAERFRSTLEVAANPICRRCVCSLYKPAAVSEPAMAATEVPEV
jgi:MoaA/NifB/PqqE/SkfB family radical SAM enzyme